MIGFTTIEIIKAIFAFFILGAFFGIFLSSLDFVKLLSNKLIFLVPEAVDRILKKEGRGLRGLRIFNSVSENILLGVSFFIFGIFAILYFYVFLDGVFRIFPIVIMIFALILSKKYIGEFALRAFEFVFSYLYAILLHIAVILLFPFVKLFLFIRRGILLILPPIYIKILRIRERKIIAGKYKNIGLNLS